MTSSRLPQSLGPDDRPPARSAHSGFPSCRCEDCFHAYVCPPRTVALLRASLVVAVGLGIGAILLPGG